MKTRLLTFLAAVVLAVAFSSCSDDTPGDKTKYADLRIAVTLPEHLVEAEFSSLTALFTNLYTGAEESVSYNDTPSRATENSGFTFNPATGILDVTLVEGRYNVAIDVVIKYASGNGWRYGNMSVTREGVTVSEAADGNTPVPVEVALTHFRTEGDFVIEEIFFTGTLTPSGGQYLGDKYFKITNNSDAVLYADGLAICESAFLTVSKEDYTPDIMSQAMSIDAIYVIPGNGTDHPVQPGESIVISDVAIDHREFNPNSFDLGKGVSDFEWFDDFEHPTMADTDNPDVPNMDKWFCASATLWGPHDRGFKSYALARPQVSKEVYLVDYFYEAEYIFVFGEHVIEMSTECYKMPNEWILDAVNCSVEAEFQWIVTDPSLDRGWTHCGTVDKDPTRYNKAVRRKTEKTADGRTVLVDSNNSTDDFEVMVKPSLMK